MRLLLPLPLAGLLLGLAAPGASPAAQDTITPAPPPACVILLHGLGRTSLSMAPMAMTLEDAGYRTANIDYASRHHSVQVLAASALPEGLAKCRATGARTLHVVTHSMGGIVLRHYLSEHDIPELGRVVMLGPPNQGSAVADRLMDQAVYRQANGPAGQQLGTGPDGIAAALGPVDFELGVLAGNQRTAVDALLSSGIEEDSDGKVTVEEAKVEGMADFRVLAVNHTFMMNDPQTQRQVLYFLEHGVFEPEAAAPPPG